MIYIYRPRYSEGAEELAYALTEASLRARYVRSEERLANVRAEDRVICWGAHTGRAPAGSAATNVLNNTPVNSKFTDAVRLGERGVPTVEVRRLGPVLTPALRSNFALPPGPLDELGCRNLIAQLQAHLDAPLPPPVKWLPRSNSHVGGNDLLRPPRVPDFWVKKESIVEEIRIHSFLGKSIRAGRKVQRETTPTGGASSPWIRSFDAGWILAYEGFSSAPEARQMAAKAIEALDLQFGAVDLARRADGSWFVLEVNRAPGIEGGTITAYVEAIRRWVAGASEERRAA